MNITQLKRNRWRVLSESQNTYEVHCTPPAHPEDPGEWECYCPAYQWGHGRECKHIKAVRFWIARQEVTKP